MAVFGFLGRSLIAMASDEVGVELGRDTVDRCRDALQMAEEKQVWQFKLVHVDLYTDNSRMCNGRSYSTIVCQ